MTREDDTIFRRRNPHRLYRDRRNGKIAGVCAGIGDYFGISVTVLRLGCIAMLFFAGPLIILGYAIAAFVIPRKPEETPYRSPDEEQFWRSVSRAPNFTFGEVRHRVRELEHRLRRMEAYITSSQFEIDRELSRRN